MIKWFYALASHVYYRRSGIWSLNLEQVKSDTGHHFNVSTNICVEFMGVGSGCSPPWIFEHGTNIIDRDLKVLFFDVFLLFFSLFFPLALPWKRLNSAIFRSFSVGSPPLKIFCRRPWLSWCYISDIDPHNIVIRLDVVHPPSVINLTHTCVNPASNIHLAFRL